MTDIKDVRVGQRVLVISPEHKELVRGTFVRTNTVVSDNREFLYATVQQDDGSFAAFDVSLAIVVTAD